MFPRKFHLNCQIFCYNRSVTSPGFLSCQDEKIRTQEVYTPPAIIEGIRTILGGIDLDPASSVEANTVVKANRIYTIEDDALTQRWVAETVWCNPPFNNGGLRLFARKLRAHVEDGDIRRAAFLAPFTGGSTWPDEMSAAADYLITLKQHLKWWGPDSTSPGMIGMNIWVFNPAKLIHPFPHASRIWGGMNTPTPPARLW